MFCQQRVAYNRQALKMYITKARLRLELELDYNVILGNKIMQVTRILTQLSRIKQREMYP
jgi:hypothetical protein